MIPPKYYLQNKPNVLDKDKMLINVSSKIVNNANINLPNRSLLSSLKNDIITKGVEKFRQQKANQITVKKMLFPNEAGYVRPEFGKLRLKNPVSRVTGHLRYTGEIVRPHLRRNPTV